MSIAPFRAPENANGVPPRPLDVAAEVRDLRATFESGRTRPHAFRAQQLDALLRLITSEESALLDALGKDLGKPRPEGWMSEVNEVVSAVKYLRKNLKRWMRPTRVSTPLALQPGRSTIVREPLGVVLVIAPWNYPLLLSLGPLAGALAAGNSVLLKPSEVAPATSAALARLLPSYLDPDTVRVIEGGVPETTEVLAQRFDHIFYTGNGNVGRIVMEAAAKHLTPVTLELGGKSPCIVDADVDVGVAAKRIVWAKFLNCGQTCVAPDYLLVHERVHDRLLARIRETITSFFGEHPEQSPDYGRIINERHHARLMGLLQHGQAVIGGQGDVRQRFIAPTVLTDVRLDSALMQEEIFGPILPVLPVSDVHQAIRFVRERPKPLALYVFSSNGETQQRVVDETSSGGVVINHAVVHLAVPELPFGGVGPSGMGAYHGKSSFDTFSHRKAVLKKGTSIDPPLVYPPMTESKQAWLRRLV